jgi:predicted PurR-regulated permease PerM
MDDQQEVKLPFYVRLACLLLSIILIVFIMHVGESIIIPLFFSLLIALVLLPITKWLERHRLPRSLAAIISILLFIIVIGSLFYFLGAQIGDFSKDLPQLGARMQAWVHELQGWVATKYHMDASRQLQYLNKGAADFARYASVIAQALLLAVGGFAIWTIFVFIFTFFILTHRGLLNNFITCLFQRKDQPRVNEILNETRLLANGYVLGLLIEMVIVAVLNCTAFLILGVRYALLLGILAAVLNIIPYLGIYTATAIAALITLSNSTPNHAFIVIIILLAVHLVDSNVLMPRIVGRRVKMNPLITIVAVLMGHLLWGIPGMFLFIPLAGILKIIFERVDGLKPWAILMGTEEQAKGDPPKKRQGRT